MPNFEGPGPGGASARNLGVHSLSLEHEKSAFANFCREFANLERELAEAKLRRISVKVSQSYPALSNFYPRDRRN